jgi:hypothetical protein
MKGCEAKVMPDMQAEKYKGETHRKVKRRRIFGKTYRDLMTFKQVCWKIYQLWITQGLRLP